MILLNMDLSDYSLSVYKVILVGVILETPHLAQVSGPTCYSCAKTYSPEECNMTATCTSTQACSVQQIFALHGDVYFWSGCEEMGICDDLTELSVSPNIVGVGRRRQVSIGRANRCLYCCTTDLCNKNCSGFRNLALHKPAYQSSVYAPNVVGANHGQPELAVDGNTDLNWFHGSCMHTDAELYPWWAVDLLHTYHISKVKIYNRNDVADRNIHLKILVSTVNATTLPKDSAIFTTCGQYIGHSGDGNVITIQCPVGTSGRWVRIQDVNPTLENFHMCEVEVYGF